ncbi:prepilin peptidase [Bacillus halotolerans]|uniref:prepilin peptidase n=1 Tax=Bacillus halotolerans TaxID=260554 RepID=UPI000D02A153|nr:A24 family peptidase [Bacillus halotolerans]MBV7318361.1 A24 family peptidase [Halalkalibacterium halodurans]PRS05699.1 prepilin peptidase [Bacillus halotolerans]PRS21172.1 prepilin peptidase [Bacillus halotolerans]QKS05469.1 prepilin peptidase [Bacillus halotolerans]QNS19052.1 prepilin peptidase [Bacillus halotolerans]
MIPILFVLGLILGSFYYTAGCRIPLHMSIINPRSACSFCRRTLTPAELIPVLSFALLKGKCKSCGQKLSLMYPAAELSTACLFAAAGFRFGLSWELIVALLFLSLLIIVSVTDIHFMLIPNRILLFFLPFLAAGRIISPLLSWYEGFIGAAAGFLLLAFIAVITHGGIGGGDVKLFAVIGLVLGVKMLAAAFFFSVFIGALYGAAAVLFGRLARKQPIPFAPAIAAGSIFAYLYGDSIISFYVKTALG